MTRKRIWFWSDGGSTAQYVYDVFRRIQEQVGSTTAEYTYDYAGRRISSWLSPNNTGNEGRIFGTSNSWHFVPMTTYFDHQDLLGTERWRTNYAGDEASSYRSLPWGDSYTARVENGSGDQDNGHFAGLERDAESGTEHAQFRNNASAQGRWLAPDSYLGSYHLTSRRTSRCQIAPGSHTAQPEKLPGYRSTIAIRFSL